MSETFELESEAYESLRSLLEQAKTTKTLFHRAGLPMPTPLARLLGNVRQAAANRKVAIQSKNRPDEAGPSWVGVPVAGASVGSLVKSFLREDSEMRPKEAVERLSEVRPDLASGSVYNCGPKFVNSGLITKVEGNWVLQRPDDCPMLRGDLLWGPPEVFQKQDLALHRRKLIEKILVEFKGGLQVLQIVEQLKKTPTASGFPCSKDLVKADMASMQESRLVKKAGNSKKWVLMDN